jgi:tRNA/tmRNA/rRNA uracil-C5-methylase (TrmA/RlmC/RlmD family)
MQVNSAAAACLFKLAGEWAAPSNDAVLLDLYCGCGSFGITLSHRVQHVIGVDNNPCSIKSAAEASAANGLQNCRFVTAAVARGGRSR